MKYRHCAVDTFDTFSVAGVFRVLVEVASLCSLNDAGFGEQLVPFKDEFFASLSSYRKKFVRIRGFSEEDKLNLKVQMQVCKV